MFGQRIAAKSLHRATLGKLDDPQQIALQVGPAELRFAVVVFQVGAEAVAT